MRHVLATSQGCGLVVSELRALLKDMMTDPYRLRRAPFAPIPLDPIIPGIAWIFSHEVGHRIAAPIVTRDLLDEVPHWCRESVARELDADIAAKDMIIETIIRSGNLSLIPNEVGNLFYGIELVIRGFVLLDSLRSGTLKLAENYPSVLEDGSPSPRLRWEYVAAGRDLYERQLGVKPRSPKVFSNWNKTVIDVLAGWESGHGG